MKIKNKLKICFSVFLITIFHSAISQEKKEKNAEVKCSLEIEDLDNLILDEKCVNKFLNLPITKISYGPLKRTKESVIKNEVKITIGSLFEKEVLIANHQKIKNLKVFSKVVTRVEENEEVLNSVKVTFEMEEKWTFIPYVIFGGGGGSQFITLGFFEGNFLGRLNLLNLNLQFKNKQISTRGFWQDPFFLGKPLVFGLSGGLSNFEYFRYDPDSHKKTGEFEWRQIQVASYLLYKISEDFNLGGGITYVKNTENKKNSDYKMSREKDKLKAENKSFTAALAELRLSLGSINYYGIQQQGVSLNSSVFYPFPGQKNKDGKHSMRHTLLMFKKLPLKSTLGLRTVVLQTNWDEYSQRFYIGGLENIRGFYDGQFLAKAAVFSNLELRVPFFLGEHISMQAIGFYDFGKTGNNLDAKLAKSQYISSAGIGYRLVPNKINALTLRLDYAWTITPYQTSGMSFGAVQFF